ncbi:hypothetical protein [Polymorphobacter megasporae]|uniref:hypothetical protein n=1 Tax=Glacieibacterium megasporae TaxID=2835787 RepID=UPI001C1DEB1C|nr:hypothetical protein [Polymorphobacter megasporae]UAJ11055.1 hypothetical protein KTC28_04905 [Polymorphobacter megasporae]
MQILGALLGLFLGPRGCLALLAFIAVEIFVGVRFGGNAPGWAALAMLILMFLPIGMRNGRAGMMRVLQVMVAVLGVKFALAAYIGLTLGRGLLDGGAWLSVAMAVGCYFGFRWLGRRIARIDEAAAMAMERLP